MPLRISPSQESQQTPFVTERDLSRADVQTQPAAAPAQRFKEYTASGRVPSADGGKGSPDEWKKEARRRGLPSNAVAQMGHLMRDAIQAHPDIRQFSVVYGTAAGRHADSGYIAGVQFVGKDGTVYTSMPSGDQGAFGPEGHPVPEHDAAQRDAVMDKLAGENPGPSAALPGASKRKRKSSHHRARLRHSQHGGHKRRKQKWQRKNMRSLDAPSAARKLQSLAQMKTAAAQQQEMAPVSDLPGFGGPSAAQRSMARLETSGPSLSGPPVGPQGEMPQMQASIVENVDRFNLQEKLKTEARNMRNRRVDLSTIPHPFGM